MNPSRRRCQPAPCLGAIRPTGDVGHGRRRHRQVAGKAAADQAGDHEEHERSAENPQQVAEGRARHRHKQHATTADPVGQRSPDRRKQELQESVQRAQQSAEQNLPVVAMRSGQPGERIDLGQKPAEEPAAPVHLEIMTEQRREERENDRKAQQIDEDREKNSAERRGFDAGAVAAEVMD